MKEDKFLDILHTIRDAIEDTYLKGHVFAVGGCIRDYILHKDINDIDIAVDIPDGGCHLAKCLDGKNMLAGSIVDYPAYSVSVFSLKDYPDVELEAVQTRKEKYDDKLSRNPVTAFGTMEEDCFRRDLTINSLYYDISNGNVIDVTGMGMDDIAKLIARTPLEPNETFDDDPLRILRTIRFTGRFGLTMIDGLWEAIISNMSRLNIVSKERIHDELVKMLKDKHCGYAFGMLASSGFLWNCDYLNILFVENDNLRDKWWIEMTGIRNRVDGQYSYLVPFVYFILRMHGADFEGMEECLSHAKFSNAEIKYIMSVYQTYRKIYMMYAQDDVCNRADVYRIMYETKDPDIYIGAVIVFSMICQKDVVDELTDYITRTKSANPVIPDFFNYKLPITGNDVMKKLKMNPGPEVRDVLNIMLDIVFKREELANNPKELWKEYKLRYAN